MKPIYLNKAIQENKLKLNIINDKFYAWETGAKIKPTEGFAMLFSANNGSALNVKNLRNKSTLPGKPYALLELKVGDWCILVDISNNKSEVSLYMIDEINISNEIAYANIERLHHYVDDVWDEYPPQSLLDVIDLAKRRANTKNPELPSYISINKKILDACLKFNKDIKWGEKMKSNFSIKESPPINKPKTQKVTKPKLQNLEIRNDQSFFELKEPTKKISKNTNTKITIKKKRTIIKDEDMSPC